MSLSSRDFISLRSRLDELKARAKKLKITVDPGETDLTPEECKAIAKAIGNGAFIDISEPLAEGGGFPLRWTRQ